MQISYGNRLRHCCAALALLVAAPIAFAQAPPPPGQPGQQQPPQPSPADTKAINGYTLTMDKIRAYDFADRTLYNDAKKDPALKAEVDKMSDEEPQATFADIEGKLTRHPRIAAYYSKLGLSNEDAVVLPIVTMMAMSAAQGRGATPATAAQVAFAKAHQKEIQSLLDAWSKDENGQE